MRKLHQISVVIVVCLFSIVLQAKEVNKQTAEEVACKVFAELTNNKSEAEFQVKEILTVKSDGKNCFYIVNFNPIGFVIISASDAAIPVLGSSAESNFSLDNLPPQLEYLFEGYKSQIKDIEKQSTAPTDEIKQKWEKYTGGTTISTLGFLKSVSTLPSQVNQLLQTSWGQGVGFNRFCPADNNGPGGHAYAGCVATAMAQILKYWGCKVSESKTHSYYHPLYGTQSVDFDEANYQWNLMGDSPSDEYNARLIKDCGVAVNMDYGPNSSGAYMGNAKTAFSSFFGFKNTSSYVYKGSSDSEWKDLLKQELSMARPILYGGLTSDTQAYGHTWVIDGYDTTDKFHCNWGGSPNYNGYFLLTNLTPDNGSHVYSSSNQAVIGLEPVMPNCNNAVSTSPRLCSYGASFFIDGLPSEATVTWEKSSNIDFVSSQGSNPCTFVPNGNGVGYIEATVHYNGDATLDRINISVGDPDYSFYPLVIYSHDGSPIYRDGEGNPYLCPNKDYFIYISTNTYMCYPSDLIWEIPSTWSVNYYEGVGVSFNTNNDPYNGVGVNFHTCCNNDVYSMLWFEVSPSCNDYLSYSLSFTPNPAPSQTILTIESKDGTKIDESIEWDLEVYDSMQSLKTKNQKLRGDKQTINTTGWKDGVYIVRVKIGKEIISEKLVVKH